MTLTMWPPLDITLEDASTWIGDTDGRTWTVNGTELKMDYPLSPRQTLTDALIAAIGTDTGVTIYASPPDVPVPPAIVITPADPYQAPYTASGAAGSAWAFELDIILRRNRSDQALDALERAREVICAALPAGWRWVKFGEVGEIIIAKKAYLKGTLGVAVATTEGMV